MFSFLPSFSRYFCLFSFFSAFLFQHAANCFQCASMNTAHLHPAVSHFTGDLLHIQVGQVPPPQHFALSSVLNLLNCPLNFLHGGFSPENFHFDLSHQVYDLRNGSGHPVIPSMLHPASKIGTSQPDRLCAQFQNLLVLRIDTLPQIPIFCQKLLWGSLTCLFFPVRTPVLFRHPSTFSFPAERPFIFFPLLPSTQIILPFRKYFPYVFPPCGSRLLWKTLLPFCKYAFYCFQLFFLGQVSIPSPPPGKKKIRALPFQKIRSEIFQQRFLQTGLPKTVTAYLRESQRNQIPAFLSTCTAAAAHIPFSFCSI